MLNMYMYAAVAAECLLQKESVALSKLHNQLLKSDLRDAQKITDVAATKRPIFKTWNFWTP